MKSFEYGDGEIGTREVSFGVSNMVIGFGVLTLPRTMANMTQSSDGWMSIVLGGAVALFMGWAIAKLTTRFPKQGFRDMAAAVTNKTVANMTTLLFAIYMMLFVSYEARGVASISKLYLFDRTPVEAISLFFYGFLLTAS
nr:GerAB/ArcD/ProY family transporter [Cohnella cholangitidis]